LIMHSADLKAEEFLDNVKVKAISKINNIITLDAEDSITRAMEILGKGGISSAPVWDNEMNSFIGFVDVLDLTIFVSYVFHENFQRHPHLYDPKELRKRFEMPVKDVINASKRDPFWTLDGNESVGFLINCFLKDGIHRVPVVDNEKLIGIVTQSDVVSLLARNSQQISIASKKLYELGLDQFPLVTIKNDATLIDALNAMVTNDVTGLAVVDFKDGHLINNLSCSDFKGVTEQNFFRLEAQLHQIFMAATQKKPPVTCSRFATLGEVINTVEKTGVHRVFIVDELNRPTSVLSLTGIMACFSRPVFEL